MSKHSKGPWSVYREPGENWIDISAIDKGSVCLVNHSDRHLPSEEDEANAALIASAPELYELARAVALGSCTADCDNEEGGGLCDSCAAKQIIARIEGGK